MIDGYWLPCKDGDARAFALMWEHLILAAMVEGIPVDELHTKLLSEQATNV